MEWRTPTLRRGEPIIRCLLVWRAEFHEAGSCIGLSRRLQRSAVPISPEGVKELENAA